MSTAPLQASTCAEDVIGIGAAYGTAKSGIGIAGVGTFRGDLIMKVCIPLYNDIDMHTAQTIASQANVYRISLSSQ